MAANVSWVLDFESADRMVILAHNNHVMRGDIPGERYGGVPSLGELLSRTETIQYRSFGFIVASGDARVVDPQDGSWERIRVAEAPDGSLSDVMARFGCPYAVVDFHTLPGEEVTDDWLAAEPKRQAFASMTHEESAQYVESDPRTDFDGILFAREGTPTRGLTD